MTCKEFAIVTSTRMLNATQSELSALINHHERCNSCRNWLKNKKKIADSVLPKETTAIINSLAEIKVESYKKAKQQDLEL